MKLDKIIIIIINRCQRNTISVPFLRTLDHSIFFDDSVALQTIAPYFDGRL